MLQLGEFYCGPQELERVCAREVVYYRSSHDMPDLFEQPENPIWVHDVVRYDEVAEMSTFDAKVRSRLHVCRITAG